MSATFDELHVSIERARFIGKAIFQRREEALASSHELVLAVSEMDAIVRVGQGSPREPAIGEVLERRTERAAAADLADVVHADVPLVTRPGEGLREPTRRVMPLEHEHALVRALREDRSGRQATDARSDHDRVEVSFERLLFVRYADAHADTLANNRVAKRVQWLARTRCVGAASAMNVILDTNHGAITIELEGASAPKTVENFLRYVDAKHYDGTIFHRVIPGFMAQGGGYDETHEKKPTEAPVENEASERAKNVRGTVAMARTSDPHSATAQFFVNVADNASLDHTAKTPSGFGYCVFGRVTSGMDVVDAIVRAKTGAQGPFAKDAPLEPIVIKSARRA